MRLQSVQNFHKSNFQNLIDVAVSVVIGCFWPLLLEIYPSLFVVGCPLTFLDLQQNNTLVFSNIWFMTLISVTGFIHKSLCTQKVVTKLGLFLKMKGIYKVIYFMSLYILYIVIAHMPMLNILCIVPSYHKLMHHLIF